VARQVPRPVPVAGPWRAAFGRWRVRRWAPRLSWRIARAVVISAAPEMWRTSGWAWMRARRQGPRQAWRAALAVPATARRWMLRKARRAGSATSRQAPSASTTVVGANGGPLVGQGGAPKGNGGGLDGRPPSLLPPPRGCARTGPGKPPSKPGPSQSLRCRTCRRCWSQSLRSPCRRPRPKGEYGRLNGRDRPPSAGRQKPGGGR